MLRSQRKLVKRFSQALSVIELWERAAHADFVRQCPRRINDRSSPGRGSKKAMQRAPVKAVLLVYTLGPSAVMQSAPPQQRVVGECVPCEVHVCDCMDFEREQIEIFLGHEMAHVSGTAMRHRNRDSAKGNATVRYPWRCPCLRAVCWV